MLTINEQITLNNINAITKQALQTKYNFINNEDYKLSPVSTYLAACAAIMSHKEAELKDIMKTACDYHIEENIKDFVKLHIKEAEYALDGERLPIDTTENAQKSAENFSENYTKLPISQRFKAAELIYKKLANKNIDLPIPLLAYANSDAIPPSTQAAEQSYSRVPPDYPSSPGASGNNIQPGLLRATRPDACGAHGALLRRLV